MDYVWYNVTMPVNEHHFSSNNLKNMAKILRKYYLCQWFVIVNRLQGFCQRKTVGKYINGIRT